MRTIKKLLFASLLSMFGLIGLPMFSLVSAKGSVYDGVLSNSTASTAGSSLQSAIAGKQVITDEEGSNLFNDQVMIIIGYVINIFIVIGIVVAFIGGYKIMTSNKEESLKEGIRLVLFGVLGIIIMVSAKFLASGLVGNDGLISSEFVESTGTKPEPNGIKLASALYNNILYPFIKIALYFVVGFLFFMMVGKVVSYVTSTDDSVKKKAGGVIIWCVVGILIVMGSKQIVEAVMGKQDAVLNVDKATWIDGGSGTGMGNGILHFENLPLVTQIINWVMGLTMFIILVLILIQGYKMFTKPDDPKNRESLKKTLLYIIIGVLVIGAAYAISSVLVINNVPVITG